MFPDIAAERAFGADNAQSGLPKKNRVKHLSVLLESSHLSQHYPDALAWRMHVIGFSHVAFFGSGRATACFGERFPVQSVYGSYLIQGDKW